MKKSKPSSLPATPKVVVAKMSNTLWQEVPPAGQVALRPGHTLSRGSEGNFICVRVTSADAILMPTSSKKRTVTTTGGISFEVTDRGRAIHVSRFTEPETILSFEPDTLARLTQPKKGTKMKLEIGHTLGWQSEASIVFHVTETTARIFLRHSGKVATIDREQNEFLLMGPEQTPEQRTTNLNTFLAAAKTTLEDLNNKQQEESTNMKSRTSKTKSTKTKLPPRGGLAVAAGKVSTPHEAKGKSNSKSKAETNSETPNVGSSKGKLGTLWGHSVVRVVVALGAAEVPFEKVMAGMKAYKLSPKETTVKQNLRLGKIGKLVGADLTKAQIAEFSSIKVAEPKEAKPAKKSKSKKEPAAKETEAKSTAEVPAAA